MDVWAPLAAVLVLALLVESMIEYFTEGVPLPAWSKKAGAAGVGVGLALVYQIDIFAFLLDAVPIWPPAGPVLTGLVLGRGANYVHDFAARALGGAQSPESKGQSREGEESWMPSPRARVARVEIRHAGTGSRFAGVEAPGRGTIEAPDTGSQTGHSGLRVRDPGRGTQDS